MDAPFLPNGYPGFILKWPSSFYKWLVFKAGNTFKGVLLYQIMPRAVLAAFVNLFSFTVNPAPAPHPLLDFHDQKHDRGKRQAEQ